MYPTKAIEFAQGTGGNHAVRISLFETGNEYCGTWFGTGVAFGKAAAAMAGVLEDVLSEMNVDTLWDPDVSVQTRGDA